MPVPIDEFYVVELLTPLQAEAIAHHISHAYQQAVARVDGTLRPVIWVGTPLAPSDLLYLSPGALQVAEAVGIHITPVRKVRAEELPVHRTLLLGTP